MLGSPQCLRDPLDLVPRKEERDGGSKSSELGGSKVQTNAVSLVHALNSQFTGLSINSYRSFGSALTQWVRLSLAVQHLLRARDTARVRLNENFYLRTSGHVYEARHGCTAPRAPSGFSHSRSEPCQWSESAGTICITQRVSRTMKAEYSLGQVIFAPRSMYNSCHLIALSSGARSLRFQHVCFLSSLILFHHSLKFGQGNGAAGGLRHRSSQLLLLLLQSSL